MHFTHTQPRTYTHTHTSIYTHTTKKNTNKKMALIKAPETAVHEFVIYSAYFIAYRALLIVYRALLECI